MQSIGRQIRRRAGATLSMQGWDGNARSGGMWDWRSVSWTLYILYIWCSNKLRESVNDWVLPLGGLRVVVGGKNEVISH